ncbi:hypothetical protein P3G55_24535 [Leptospira sp. 96542]|nr:hypothetical protein [Leptospira sp. 96542]
MKNFKMLYLALISFALALAGIVCLVVGVLSLWEGKDLVRAATGLGGGLLLLFAASIERFEVLKGLGIEARTRQLDAAIDQATATLEQLRELATSFSGVALTELMSGHFAYGGATLKVRIELHDELLQTLKALGISARQIDTADQNWRKGIASIYRSKIIDLVGKNTPPNRLKNVPDSHQLAAQELEDMFSGEDPSASVHSQAQQFLESRGLMTPEIQEWMADYDFYLKNKRIRRVDEFAAE